MVIWIGAGLPRKDTFQVSSLRKVTIQDYSSPAKVSSEPQCKVKDRFFYVGASRVKISTPFCLSPRSHLIKSHLISSHLISTWRSRPCRAGYAAFIPVMNVHSSLLCSALLSAGPTHQLKMQRERRRGEARRGEARTEQV
jgi:hypothetical protein